MEGHGYVSGPQIFQAVSLDLLNSLLLFDAAFCSINVFLFEGMAPAHSCANNRINIRISLLMIYWLMMLVLSSPCLCTLLRTNVLTCSLASYYLMFFIRQR